MSKQQRPPVAWRHLAVKCHHQSNGHMPAAIKLFQEGTQHKCMARPREFIATWAKRFAAGLPLDRDAPRSGRPWSLKDHERKDAAKLFLQGSQQEGSGKQLQFTSIRDALNKSPALRQYQATSRANDKTMLRNIRKADPGVCQRTERFHQPMSDSQKTARCLACRQLISKPRH